jgi:hypothetical protein
MAEDRRKFLGNVAALSAGGMLLPSALGAEAPLPRSVSAEWDMTWKERVTGSVRAVFDSPEVNEGAGLWRAADWKRTMVTVYGDQGKDASAVLVIRHRAIPMIMNDAFWERHNISTEDKITWEGKNVSFNPFVARPDASGNDRAFKLDGFMAAGGIVLACNYAFGLLVSREAKKAGISNAEAREATLRSLLPGVILQPSGFFAVIEAQRVGCHFFPASG